jgi:CDP-diacylglycerol--glycerol-3-phosphate 3-phosphatidyltransferase
LFNDVNAVVHSANLSNDYFTNRQDRYMEFTNHSPLADYFASLLDTVGSYSFLASATDTTSTNPALNITWPTSNPAPSPLARGTSMKEYKSQAHEAFTSLTRHWNSKSVHALCSSLPPPTPSSTPASQVYDTSVRPVLQIGPFSITQETDLVVPTIFRTGNSLATAPGGAETTIDWTSGYFSVQEAYRERVLDSRSAVRIVAAAPEVRCINTLI